MAPFDRLADHLSREEQSHQKHPTWASHYTAFLEILQVRRAYHAGGPFDVDTEQDITAHRPRQTWLRHSGAVGSLQRPYIPRSLATAVLCRALVGLCDDGRTECRSGSLAEYVTIRAFTSSFTDIFWCMRYESLERCKALSMFLKRRRMRFRAPNA